MLLVTRTGTLASLALALALAPGALGVNPVMGGPMKHVMVELMAGQVHVMVDPNVETPLLRRRADVHTGAAAVLTDTMYNAQYGWMAEGPEQPPLNAFFWIEQVSATPGLLAYSGGSMMNPATYAPIFGTGGSAARILWSGTMQHNWYASIVPGQYSASYRVYVGDASGAPVPGFTPGEVTLNWIAPPECVADFQMNGVIDTADLAWFLGRFGQPAEAGTMNQRADLNADGVVDTGDLVVFLGRFGGVCPN